MISLGKSSSQFERAAKNKNGLSGKIKRKSLETVLQYKDLFDYSACPISVLCLVIESAMGNNPATSTTLQLTRMTQPHNNRICENCLR